MDSGYILFDVMDKDLIGKNRIINRILKYFIVVPIFNNIKDAKSNHKVVQCE